AMYLADLSALDGDAAAASRALLALVHDDPSDVCALSSLLDVQKASPRAEVSGALSRAPLREHSEAALRAWLADAPRDARPWHALSAFRTLTGDSHEAARAADRARALGEACDRDARAIGRVLAAAVLHFPGKTKGLIHQIWADRRPA